MNTDIVTTLRRESFYRPTSRINSYGKAQIGFELMSINLQAADEIERLRKKRDEARRMACEMEERVGCDESGCPKNGTAREKAKGRGWDCFKENA